MHTETRWGLRSAFALLVLTLAGAGVATAAERTRELIREFPATAGPLRLGNLMGHARLVQGSGVAVRVVATVHADGGTPARTQALLQSIRWAEERHDGYPEWVLTYPVDEEQRYRSLEGSGWGTTLTRYRGRRVRIGGWASGAPLLYVDLRIEVPAGASLGLKNRLGRIDAQGVDADLILDTNSGDVAVADHTGSLGIDTGSGTIAVSSVLGDVNLDTGSGEIRLQGARGSVDLDTGSGDVTATDVDGSRIHADTGSGRIVVRRSRARELEADTGSGDVLLEDVDAESFLVDTGSGSVTLTSPLQRARVVDVDTGSGDVVIRTAAAAAFHLTADQGSGDLRSGFADAHPIAEGRTVIGYERGDGRTRIRVDTGSGDCVIEPAGS
ncbi:MAG: DUF4097 family beta strand repeat-containing protein [Thermoanaerobaculia bacterium]